MAEKVKKSYAETQEVQAIAPMTQRERGRIIAEIIGHLYKEPAFLTVAQIREVLAFFVDHRANGSINQAARLLGVSAGHLHSNMTGHKPGRVMRSIAPQILERMGLDTSPVYRIVK